MAWTAVSGTVPQYQKSDGTLASAYYLKAYTAGTTSPISIATDTTGGTTLAKVQLDASGYPINGSGAAFIPHIDQAYKLILYKNATDADANTTANADWVIDNIQQFDQGGGVSWLTFGGAPTYVSASSFTLTGDQTSLFLVGTRLRLTDSSTLYGTITNSVYTSLTTVTVALDSGSLTAGLSAVATSNFIVTEIPHPALFRSIDSVSELLRQHVFDGAQYEVRAYHGDKVGPSARYIYNSTVNRNTHNGGTVISPTATFPSDWTNQTQLAAYFDGSTLTGTGCFVLQYKKPLSLARFGAKGDGTTRDDKPAQKWVDCGENSLLLPKGRYLFGEKVIVPNELTIVGEDARRSIIYINSDIDGVQVKRFCTFKDMRFIGTSAVSNTKALVHLGFVGDSPHSRFYNVTFGGQDTAFGDSTSDTYGGNGVIGGNTFLNQFMTCFFYKCYRGFWNTSTSGSVATFAPANNSLLFSGCSFTSNTLCAVEADIPQGVSFHTCDFENNGNYGLKLKDARSVTVDTCHFENNGFATPLAIPNADITTTQGGGGTTGLNITNSFFLRGSANLTRAIDVDSQFNVAVTQCYFNNYNATGVLSVEITTNSTGIVENCYATGPNNVTTYSMNSLIRHRNLYSTQTNGQLLDTYESKLFQPDRGIKLKVNKLVTSSANINHVVNLDNYQIYTLNNSAGFNITLDVPNPATNTGRAFKVVKDTTNIGNVLSIYSSAAYPIVGGSTTLSTDADGSALQVFSDGTSWVCTRIAEPLVGSFAPTLWDSSLNDSEGQTYAVQSGRYIRQGNLVYITGRLVVTSIGTLTTGQQAKIGGIPFTAENVTDVYHSIHIGRGLALGLAATGYSVTGNIAPNTNYINLEQWNATTGVAALTVGEVTAAGDFIFSGCLTV